MANTTKGKLFYAEAVKGYTLKVMIDSLALSMSRTVFKASKKGFFHRNMDEAEHILFDVKFSRKNFRPYVCREEVTFSFNLKHLQKMVRNVKKKDSIIMFITKKDPAKLYLAIRPSGSTSGHNSRLETVFITITQIKNPEQSVDLPEVYVDADGNEIGVYLFPMVIDAADFQKIKKMTTGVGKTMLVEMQRNNYISFSGDNGELYGTKLEFGEILDNPESEEENEPDDYSGEETKEDEVEKDEVEEDEGNKCEDVKETEDEEDDNDYENDEDDEIKGWYEAEFNMNIFSLLMKLPGLCSQMQFYAPKIERYPLKISMQAGTLGEITIYIKDKKQIAVEETQRDQRQADEISNAKSAPRRTRR